MRFASIDMRVYPFGATEQFARAERALDRFRLFANGPATDMVLDVMRDEMLEAAEAIWHIHDHLEHDFDLLKQYGGHDDVLREAWASYRRVQASPEMQALRTLANASKHGRLDNPGSRADAKLTWDIAPGETPDGLSLADCYRKMQVLTKSGAPTHPTEFLEGRIREWKAASGDALNKLYGERIMDARRAETARVIELQKAEREQMERNATVEPAT